MDLKSGCIFWPQIHEGTEPSFPSLTSDLKCDVAIIGGGISGALAAFYLSRAGIESVLVDRRSVGHGSTAASTGLLQYEIDVSLVELTRRLGKASASAAYRASLDAVLAFEPLVSELKDRCGLVARPSMYLASGEKEVDELRLEYEARRSIGIEVEFLNRDRLKAETGLSRPAALWSKHAFEIDPFRLTLNLIERAFRQGLRVFTATEITQYEPHGKGVNLIAANGARIEAGKVIFATGYETLEFIPRNLTRLFSTYAAASQPLPDFREWPQRCLIWETSRPYFYLRTTEDRRAMIGGEDEPFIDPQKRDSLIREKAQRLGEKLAKLFPHLHAEIDCAWAGVFAQTKDGLPYIGTLPQFPHGYFALGFGGNGITFSLLAAQIIRDRFLDKTSPMTSLFGFQR